MESDDIVTFIKAIDKQFFSRFINDGQVCMNTLKWFRDYEKLDSNIGDKFEGAEMVCGKGLTLRMANPIKFYSSEKELKSKMESANWTEIGKGDDLRYFPDDNANLFSLYAIKSDALDDQTGNYLVPQKFIDEFSNHRFIIFLQPNAFISKMNNAISKLGKSMKCGIVRYYKLDENLVKYLSYFNKPDIYSYQNEFRLLFKDEKAVQQIFSIGSLNESCLEIDINIKYSLELIDNDHFSIKSID